MRCPSNGSPGKRGVGQDLGGPHAAKLGGELDLKLGDQGRDVIAVSRFIARLVVDELCSAHGIVRNITHLYGSSQQSCSIGIDDNGGPDVLIIDCLTDGYRVVVVF